MEAKTVSLHSFSEPPSRDPGYHLRQQQCLQKAIHQALVEGCQHQSVRVIVAAWLPDGDVGFSVSDALPLGEKEELFLVGLTDDQGSEITIHPAWTVCLRGGGCPLDSWFIMSEGHTPLTIRAYERWTGGYA